MNEEQLKAVKDRIRKFVTIIPDVNGAGKGNADKTIKRICTNLSNIVPVICEDMYEYRKPGTDEVQSLHSYLVEKVLSGCDDVHLSEEQLDDIVNLGYYGMSLLSEILGKEVFADLYEAVFDYDNIIDGVQLKKEVAEFLKVCKFKMIVTTSCFPIIEKTLGNEYESYWYELEKECKTELPSHCVFHLFGQAKFNTDQWGFDEQRLHHFLRCAYSGYPLKNLSTYNNGKTLLVLGNDAPDWLFRFILTPIYYQGNVYDKSIGYYINDNCQNEERSLNHFLRQISFKKESQLIKVLSGVIEEFKKNKTHKSGDSKHNKKYDFFIAHASEDDDVVKLLRKRLGDNKLKVWVDKERIDAGKYWNHIIDGIKNSKYFMPLVSEEYMYKIKRKKDVDKIMAGISDDVFFTSDKCVELEKKLGGVQIELLLASRWFAQHPKEVYSIPVVLKDAEYVDGPLTLHRISELGNKGVLPSNLFAGLQGYEFDSSNPESFELNWDRFKQ